MTPADPARPALRHHDSETVFQEQWHAQLIAIWDILVAQGRILPADWASVLGAELARSQPVGEAASEAGYYAAFLAALEKVLETTGTATPAEIDKRTADWRAAYLGTPHGQPVKLATQAI